MDDSTQNDDVYGGQPTETPVEQPGQQTPEPVAEGGKFKIRRPFVIGFLGWYAVMALVYGILIFDKDNDFVQLICVLQGILLMILFLVRKQRSIAWGVISAIGVNFFLSLLLNLFLNAICFVPFFYPKDF